MCKFNPKNKGRRKDPCMLKEIDHLEAVKSSKVKILACCCGHKKYPKTIVIRHTGLYGNYKNQTFDYISGKLIPRKKRFYKRDSKGVYYIPEVLE